MQTSKIKLGNIYAIKRGNDHVRFHVQAINTRKTGNGTSNTIEGYIVEDGVTGGARIAQSPEDIIGPFDQVAELVERKAQEDAERVRKGKEHRASQSHARQLLYKFIGVAPPKDATDHRQPFRLAAYDTAKVDISDEGVTLIVERIKAMTPNLKVVEK